MAPNLLTAADVVRASTSSLPTEQRGSILPARPDMGIGGAAPGWSVFEAQQHTVPVDALRWPKSVHTYEDMCRDAQIQGLLMSVFLPLRHMEWYLDPNGAPDSLVNEIAEDFGLPLDGQDSPEDGPGLDFDDHLRTALQALAVGHKMFEESGVIEGNGPSARYRLRDLSERPNETLQRIDVTAGGDLMSIRVPSAQPDVDGPFVDVPADHLLAYVWDRRGADWAGRPLLYGLYRNWLLKDDLIRTNATMFRRFSGIPVVESTIPDISEESHTAAAAMAMRVRSGDTAGVSMPYGTRLRLLGLEGTVPDALPVIVYHDSQMARAFMQMFAELGQNGRGGSRALGATLMDHYALGVLAVAKWVRKTLMLLVRRVAVRNYGPDVQIPRILSRQDDNEDLPIDQLVQAIDAGLIVVDDDLEAQVRERGNLVPRNKAEQGRAPAPKAPVAAAAKPAPSGRGRVAAATTTPPADRSQTDFADLQSAYVKAVEELTASWGTVRASLVDELVAQIQTATTITALTAIAAPAVTGAVLTDILSALVEHGAQSVASAAAAQGVTVTTPDLQPTLAAVTDAADATTTLLASSLAQSAASHAVGLWGPDPDPVEIADLVRQHLVALAGATEGYEFAGLASRAQNEGRFDAMDQDGQPGDYYASSVNDLNSCAPCLAEDDTEYPSMVEARRDFPAGGYLGCDGRKRCRCTIVKVYTETPGQAA